MFLYDVNTLILWYAVIMSPGPKKRFNVLLGVRMEPELFKRLGDAAKGEERFLGAMARILMREALDAREGKGKTAKKKSS